MCVYQGRLLSRMVFLPQILLAGALCAGADGGLTEDGGADAGSSFADAGAPEDAGVIDGGGLADGGGTSDAGPADGGPLFDAGASADAGPADGGIFDAGAQIPDAGGPLSDAGAPADAGSADGGGASDAGLDGGEATDAGLVDNPVPSPGDGGAGDAGVPAFDAGAGVPAANPPLCEDACVDDARLGRCSASGQRIPVACGAGESCVEDRCVADSAVVGVGCSCQSAGRENAPFSLPSGLIGLMVLWGVSRRARRGLGFGAPG